MDVWKIQQGCHDFMGGWNSRAWVLHIKGQAALKFDRLADAKDAAALRGYTGKWVRSVEGVGPRGLGCVTYKPVVDKEVAAG